MTLSNIFNIVGLILDIIGVLMLFKYGIPPEVSKDGSFAITINIPGETEIAKAKGKKYTRLSNLALTLLFLGFFIQLVANLIPWICDMIHKN